MKWCSPYPKYTNDISILNWHDLYKRNTSRKRFLAREDAEPIKKHEFYVGVWNGFRFINTGTGEVTKWNQKEAQ